MIENYIVLIADALDKNVPVKTIHDALSSRGKNENDIFLLVKAAEIFSSSRKESIKIARQKPMYK